MIKPISSLIRKLPTDLIAWLLLLGPLTIWFVHFGFVYAVPNVENILTGGRGHISQIVIAVASIAALALIMLIAYIVPSFAPRDKEPARLWVYVTRFLSLVASLAIIFQTLPIFLV